MKGIINENIVDMLNLRPLDEVLKEKGVELEQQQQAPVDDDTQPTIDRLRDISAKLTLLDGNDHGESMDTLHDEILQHARDLMTYGYNIDQPRARGIFEVAATMFGHAMNAKNSKRDAQIKSMKLALDRKRVELDEKRTNHTIGATAAAAADTEGTILVEDRNELLRRLRQQVANPE